MANFVYNQSLGKVAELGDRVQGNDPTNSAFIIVALVSGGATDATLRDYDDLAAIEGDANAAEATNSGYNRETVTTVTVTVDDPNNQIEVDIADTTWTSVAAGDNWTDIITLYDNDTTAGTDANIVPMTQHDFAVTPDGSDITAQYGADGFYTASSTA